MIEQTIYILAFNYNEAKNYLRKQNQVNTRHIILNSPDQLRGVINPDVHITGQAYLRPDFNEFIDVLKTRIFK